MRERLLAAGVALGLVMANFPSDAAAKPIEIGWSALRSAATSPGLPTGTAGSVPAAALEGSEITLAGFLLPIDRDGDLVYEFLLLPAAGACSHMPQPPPNQVIHVAVAEPVRVTKVYEPVAVTGTLRRQSETSQLMILDGPAVVESGYSIGSAKVGLVAEVPDAVALPKSNPWGFAVR